MNAYQEAAAEARATYLLSKPKVIAVDTETEGVAWHDPAFGVSIAFADETGETRGYWFELAKHDCSETVRTILTETPLWAFHNAKFDLQKLILAGIITREEINSYSIHDTEALAHLLDENQTKKLKDLAPRFLGVEIETVDVVIKSGPNEGEIKKVPKEKFDLDAARRELKLKKSDGYHMLPRKVVTPYARTDAIFTYDLFQLLFPILMKKDIELIGLYKREMELSLVLLDIEAAGMGVDIKYVQEVTREVARDMLMQELKLRQLADEEEFIDSPKWIKKAFAKYDIELPNTQKETLAEVDHELAATLMEYRRLKKLHSTYLTAILEETGEDSILHPHFRQHGTKTGRMSAGGYDG